MVWHGDGLPRASGAGRIVFLQYNVHGGLSFPINIVMVTVVWTFGAGVWSYASQVLGSTKFLTSYAVILD